MPVTYASAQNTLCIKSKATGEVRYGLAEKPTITYVGDNMHLVTGNISVDYPLSDLESVTFVEGTTALNELNALREDAAIYNLSGVLVQTLPSGQQVSGCDLSKLPSGVYIIK